MGVYYEKEKRYQKPARYEEKKGNLCILLVEIETGTVTVENSTKVLKIELPRDRAIPLLGIYPKEMKS